MAGKNQVTLTFAGDADKLTKTIDQVGSSTEKMSHSVDESSSSFDHASHAAENTYDKFDSLEAVGRGTKDTMTGLGEIMSGNVLQGSTDLAGGVAALADGIGGALIPGLRSAVGWLGKTKAGLLAQAATTKIVSAATKVWAGVQAAFNLVMAANPVVLITIAIIALVAAIVIAWKKSETFRSIVLGAFHAIAAGARAVVGVFVSVGKAIAAPFIAGFNAIRNAWNSTIGGRGFTIPTWVPIIGGKSFTIPYFHTGGIVGGSGEQLAMVKGGEGVFTREQMAAMGGSGNIVIEFRGSPGNGLEAMLLKWLKESVRIEGGDPAMFQRKVAYR